MESRTTSTLVAPHPPVRDPPRPGVDNHRTKSGAASLTLWLAEVVDQVACLIRRVDFLTLNHSTARRCNEKKVLGGPM